MNENEGFFTETKDALKAYVDDRLLLLKLQATDKLSKMLATIVVLFVVIILGLITLLLVGITTGYLFADITNSFWKGFAISTGIYALLIVIVLLIKKSIQKPIINGVITAIFKEDKNEIPVGEKN